MRLEAAEAEAASLRAELGAVRREGGAREAAALREEEARRAAEAEAARLSVELRAAIVRAAAAEEEGAAAAELMEARRAAAEARRRREEEEVRAQGCNRTHPSLQPSCAQGCGPCARGFDPVYPRLPRPHAPGARGARGRGRGHAAARGPREAADGAVRGRVGGALRQHARVRSHMQRGSSPSEPVSLRRVQVREDVEARLRELGPSAVQLGRRCADAEARADAAEEAAWRTKARTRASAARHAEALSRRHEVRPPPPNTASPQPGSTQSQSPARYTRRSCACCGPSSRTRNRRCAPCARCNPT